MLGVLGGMGPLATADFLSKIVSCTPGKQDADHLPVVMRSIPQIPDRTRAIIDGGVSPIGEMVRHARALKSGGARIGAMPCNTAHHWYEQLVCESGLEFIHIADAAIDSIRENGHTSAEIGLLSTPGTLSSGFYQERLALHGYSCLVPRDDELEQVYRGISWVKSGHRTKAFDVFQHVVQTLIDRGAEVVILGCTELPAVLNDSEKTIDSTMALARACVRHFCLTPAQPTRALLPMNETCVSISHPS